MKLLYTAVALLFSIILISCGKDLSYESGSLPLGMTPPPANNNALVNNYCKDCNYVPQCSGSVYKYSDTSGSGSVSASTQTWAFEKDTVVNAATYRKFNITGGNPAYMNCQTNTTTVLSVNGTSAGGTSVPLLKLVMLKATAAAGTSWTDNLTISGIPATYTSTLVAKNFSRTVNGTIYPDVMHVKQILSANYPGLGATDVAESNYFYAKGIGLVEAINVDLLSGTQALHRVLVSATIP